MAYKPRTHSNDWNPEIPPDQQYELETMHEEIFMDKDPVDHLGNELTEYEKKKQTDKFKLLMANQDCQKMSIWDSVKKDLDEYKRLGTQTLDPSDLNHDGSVFNPQHEVEKLIDWAKSQGKVGKRANRCQGIGKLQILPGTFFIL